MRPLRPTTSARDGDTGLGAAVVATAPGVRFGPWWGWVLGSATGIESFLICDPVLSDRIVVR